MLKLIFDVKCGFESIYLVEKNLEFPLDFLTNKALFNANNYNLDLKYLDENALYSQYALDPDKFVLDYKLFEVLRVVVSQEYFEACFKNFKKNGKVFFPELFILENVSIKKSDNTDLNKMKVSTSFDDSETDTDFDSVTKDTKKYDA